MNSSKTRIPLITLLMAMGVYSAIILHFGRLQGVDEVAFKAAGREWAAHGRFAAPELRGFKNFNPPAERAWFGHLPLYTFLFGLFVKLFGFGPTQSIAFDLTIHMALVLVTWRLAEVLSNVPSAWPAAVAGAAVLPISTPGRPDELAMCFGIVSLVIFVRPVISPRFSLVLSAALLGAAGATSAVCAAFYVLVVGARVWFTHASRVLQLLVWCGVALCVTALVVAPFALSPPGVWRQFVLHAGQQFGVPWRQASALSLLYGWQYLAVALIGIAGMGAEARSSTFPGWAARWSGIALVIAILVIVLPSKYLYVWFLGPVIFATMASNPFRYERRLWLPATVVVVSYMIAVIPNAKDMLIMMHLSPGQRLGPNVALIRRLIPRGATVLATEYWSSMANEYDYRYHYSDSNNPPIDDVDYIILTANGSGKPGLPQTLGVTDAPAARRDFAVICDRLKRRPSQILGPFRAHSAWGFGPRILARRQQSH